MRELMNFLPQSMKPRFHEISAYLIALTCCWLFVFHAKLRETLLIIFGGFGTFSPYFIVLGLIVLWGLLLSLAHALLRRKKSASEKYFMGWFIMGTSGIASFGLGVEMLPLRSSIMLILPAWNILIGVLLFFQMAFQEYVVSDEDASLREVFGTTTILVCLLLLADFGLRLSWAMTLSICIFYSTTIVFLATQVANYFYPQPPAILK